MTETSSGWLEFIGRLHPSLVHLPIGFIVILAVIEVAAGWTRFKEAVTARPLLLWLSVMFVTVTAGCGWILSWSGGYAEETLAWHKWLGTALVPIVVVLQVLLRYRAMVSYRICLGLTLVLLIGAGHYGGTLVRGEGYLFKKSRTPAITSRREASARPGTEVVLPANGGLISKPTAFASLVQPIFNEYCIGCHGAEKSKAKLRLDSASNLFRGGDSGPVIKLGDATQSLLIKRLHLPAAEDEHMPPSGKKQPTAREIALLEWWINVGTPVDKMINDLNPTDAK